MAGGLIQLLAWGSQNIKLNGNPSLTFFKKVLRAHTNFSMESIQVQLSRTDANMYENTMFKAKLKRHGDLVQQIYFVFELPDIKPNDVHMQWVQNIGEALVDNVYVNIGGTIVDRQYGEQMHIQSQLSMTNDKRNIYERMIGNVPELVDPKQQTGTYPTSNPAIPSRKIYVPLNFWFNRDTAYALPLISLQYNDVEITMETRPFAELYQVMVDGLYSAPNSTIPSQQLGQLVSNARSTYMTSNSVLDIKAYLEVNYIFLDKKEREMVTYKPHEYLVEQTFRIQRFALAENNIFELVLQNPVKELLWVFKRNDQRSRNDWFNFLDDGQIILRNAKIMFNGMDRIDEKDHMYFNLLQPFQHHTSCPKDGIYVYSFAIMPDQGLDQPSGSCNMSRIQKIQMMMNVMRPVVSTYKYDVTLYAIGYNFLKISSGLAGIVFSN